MSKAINLTKREVQLLKSLVLNTFNKETSISMRAQWSNIHIKLTKYQGAASCNELVRELCEQFSADYILSSVELFKLQERIASNVEINET